MKIERQQILSVIFASIEAINEMKADNDKLETKEDTLLFGPDTKLDSLGLVNLVIDIEERFDNEFGIEVILTDERVISDEEINAFESVKTLANYIEDILKEDSNG